MKSTILRMKPGKSVLLFTLLLSIFLLMSFLQDEGTIINIQKIQSYFAGFMNIVKPQKIYIQTDKMDYLAGERIWFKAYLVDGVYHRPDSTNDPVYVELINPSKNISQALRLRIVKGEGEGSFFLYDTVPEGIFQLRAYTNWMRNAGPAFYFTRNIRIKNPSKEFHTTAKEARVNRKKVKKLEKEGEKFAFGLFPEGGNMLLGVRSLIAFKATDGYGRGIDVTGFVSDKNKHEISQIRTKHDGMGFFILTPSPGEKYTANIKFPDGSRMNVPLPGALENAVNISVSDEENIITVKVQSNKPVSGDRPANEFILIGQTRGKIYYLLSKNLLDRDSLFMVDPSIFPSGIAQFTLINNRLLPVSERLYFINRGNFINFNITGNKTSDSIQFNIAPQNGIDFESYFSGSVSVLLTDSAKSFSDQGNILTELLLSSDLPGIIQNPSFYLQPNTYGRKSADLLMLTNGWKRFHWQDIMNRNTIHINYEREEGITVEGRITREIFEFPIKDASVSLFVLNAYNDEYRTTTDSDGRFIFSNLDYEDTMSVRLVARKEGGGKNVLIQLNQETMPDLNEYAGKFYLTTSSKIDMKDYRRYKADLAREQMKMRQKELDSIFSGSIYGTPDYVLWGKDIPPGTNNVLDAMRGRIPGVSVIGNSVVIRGVNTFYGSTDPLLLIDGVVTSFDAINTISVSDIDRIEILKGPSAAMFGSRGANGVIAIYTKHGMFMKKGEISFSMLGYHIVEHFSSPPDVLIEKRIEDDQLPVTLYWNANIKMSASQHASISFPIKNIPDKQIQVIVEGINNAGTAGYCFATFNK
jgi:TonB-dependent SusC/RagA subfamily outer membrane receptor